MKHSGSFRTSSYKNKGALSCLSQIAQANQKIEVTNERKIQQLWDDQQAMEKELPDNPKIQEAMSLIHRGKINQALDLLKADRSKLRNQVSWSAYSVLAIDINCQHINIFCHDSAPGLALSLFALTSRWRITNQGSECKIVSNLKSLTPQWARVLLQTHRLDRKSSLRARESFARDKAAPTERYCHHSPQPFCNSIHSWRVFNLQIIKDMKGPQKMQRKQQSNHTNDSRLIKTLISVKTPSDFKDVQPHQPFHFTMLQCRNIFSSDISWHFRPEDNLDSANSLTSQLKQVYENFARELALAEAQKLSLLSLRNTKIIHKTNNNQKYVRPPSAAAVQARFFGVGKTPYLKEYASEQQSSMNNQVTVNSTFQRNVSLRPKSALEKANAKSDKKSGTDSKQEQNPLTFNNNYISKDESFIQSKKNLKEELLILQQRAEEERQAISQLIEKRIMETKKLEQLQKNSRQAESMHAAYKEELLDSSSRREKRKEENQVESPETSNPQVMETKLPITEKVILTQFREYKIIELENLEQLCKDRVNPLITHYPKQEERILAQEICLITQQSTIQPKQEAFPEVLEIKTIAHQKSGSNMEKLLLDYGEFDSNDVEEAFEYLGDLVATWGSDRVTIVLQCDKKHQYFSAVYDDNLKFIFKVVQYEKVLQKFQNHLKVVLLSQQKAYILNDYRGGLILRVYSHEHEQSAIVIQNFFKLMHYQRKIKVRIPQEGELYVGRRKHTDSIYVAITTVGEGRRNFYKFPKKNYRQFIERIQFKIISNLKYTQAEGIFLLQEPEHCIIASNPKAKIFSFSPGQRFIEKGEGKLNAIYDALGRKIILASEDRKMEAVSIDIPKHVEKKQEIRIFAEKLLMRSFIIHSRSDKSVIYYEERDVDSVLKIQQAYKKDRILKRFTISFTYLQDEKIEYQELEVELINRKFGTYFILLKEPQLSREFIVGYLRIEMRKYLRTNLQRFVSCFLSFDGSEITLNVSLMLDFLNNPTTFEEMDILEVGKVIDNRGEFYAQENQLARPQSTRSLVAEYIEDLMNRCIHQSQNV